MPRSNRRSRQLTLWQKPNAGLNAAPELRQLLLHITPRRPATATLCPRRVPCLSLQTCRWTYRARRKPSSECGCRSLPVDNGARLWALPSRGCWERRDGRWHPAMAPPVAITALVVVAWISELQRRRRRVAFDPPQGSVCRLTTPCRCWARVWLLLCLPGTCAYFLWGAG